MDEKFMAKFIGGPNDGQIWQIEEIAEQIKIGFRTIERKGRTRITATATYRLKSRKPLEYKFES